MPTFAIAQVAQLAYVSAFTQLFLIIWGGGDLCSALFS